MRKLLLFRIALYGTAVALLAFYFFGQEGGDDAVAAVKELEGETSQGHPMLMHMDDDGKVTYFDMELDWSCPYGHESSSRWYPSPGWADFRHSGGVFTATERAVHGEPGWVSNSIFTMRAEIDDGGREVSGVARVVIQYRYSDRSVHVCDSGDVRFVVER